MSPPTPHKKKEPLPLPKKMGMERYKYNTKKIIFSIKW